MDMNNYKLSIGFNIVALICFGIMMLFGTAALIFAHEVTHKTIYSYYGLDSEIIVYNNTPATKLIDPYVLVEQKSEVMQLQGLTEIIGYQVLPSTLLVCLILIIGFSLVLIKMDLVEVNK